MNAEAVRLLIWDLDETFWRGTVTEGGITEYVQAHHDIVVELARRGIISSICSKNDPATVRRILEDKGIFDYFVFPSISWEPKGARLAQLVEAVQLRAPTVMFIDDNPNNRAEAASIVPGLQIEDESFIPAILADPRFKGKSDPTLSRLKQYKLLEERKRDEQTTPGSNEDFLRSCDIRVCIEYDVESQIDRAIELINRTNQLNFTKRRLSEDIEVARQQLRDQMRPWDRSVGLVRVADKYGDYGFVGFFMTGMMRRSIQAGAINAHLEHFCFSCRTLGMLVEQWVYEHLGKPELQVAGEVLTDLSVPRKIDWIRLVETLGDTRSEHTKIASQIVLYGGCEANAIGIYLAAHTDKLDVHGNYVANGIFVNVNYGARILDLANRQNELFAREAETLGLPLELESADMFATAPPGALFVVNLAMDAQGCARLRHRQHGWEFVLSPNGFGPNVMYNTQEAELTALLDPRKSAFTAEQQQHILRVSRHIRSSYDYVDKPNEAELVHQMRMIISRIPIGAKFIVIAAHDEIRPSNKMDEIRSLPWVANYRTLMQELTEEFAFAGVVSFTEVLHSRDEILRENHFSRAVYLRLAQRIIEVAGGLQPRSDRPEPADTAQVRKPIMNENSPMRRTSRLNGGNEMSDQIDPRVLRTPEDLAATALAPRRVLIVGSCLSEHWALRMNKLPQPCETELYLLGRELPDAPERSLEDYDFQFVQLTLRSILPDGSFARLSQTDLDGHEKLFNHSFNTMRRFLDGAMRWNREYGLLTFVFPFLVPMQNPVGRLMPRYDLRNPVYFVEKLNEALSRELEAYKNTYLIDLNEIYAFYGRRFVQEDIITSFNHGGLVSDFDFRHDSNRLETAKRASDIYEQRLQEIFQAGWNEVVALYRTLRQIDTVKMVVIDLDDTLWRGVIAELDLENLPTSEGWPKAFWETLLFLKRRGILLAVISKNEQTRVESFWEKICGRILKPGDFAVRCINWRPKTENMAEILANVNLLPRNVVYIDDNPAERAAIKAAFPEIRVLGGTPLAWRRILLWSAETQVPDITSESAARTEMVRAQVVREEQRKAMPHSEFLASLEVKMNFFGVESVGHPRFARVLELINKTNQFNTTGKRWTREECIAAFEHGTRFYAFEVADHYTDYGLVGVLIVDHSAIRQFVMSCRIMGLEAELAAVAMIMERLHNEGAKEVFAAMVNTDRNMPCREVYAQCGFSPAAGGWRRAATPALAVPAHITITNDMQRASSLADTAA